MSLPPTAVLDVRLTRMRARLAEAKLDALVVTQPANQRYLASHRGSAGVLVVTPTRVDLLVDTRYQEAVRARQESLQACPGLQPHLVPGSYDDALVEYSGHAGCAGGRLRGPARERGYPRRLAPPPSNT